MKISIIIISYNQGCFLEETINSVINQNYEDKEIILIDGGSTDESPSIIKKYASYFKYYVSEKDEGQADAIIKGFSRADGDLITWINSDDLLLPGTLEAVKNKANQVPNREGVFYGGCFIIDKYGRVQDRFRYERFNYFISKRLGPTISQPGTFFSLKAYNSIGGVKKNFHYCMDKELFCNLLFCGYQFYYTNLYHAKFRKYSEQKGHSKLFLQKCADEEKYIHEAYNFHKVTKISKQIARSLQVFIRFVNGYYFHTAFFRIKIRKSFRQYLAKYIE